MVVVPLIPLTSPPQVAMTGLGSDMKKVAWEDLAAGRLGGEQVLVLGKTSTEESLLPTNPPEIKRRLSFVLDRALFGYPG